MTWQRPTPPALEILGASTFGAHFVRTFFLTSNQRRAIALAQGILAAWPTPQELGDADWHLLLLAAGLNNFRALPRTVAARVMDRSERHAGYFTVSARSRTAASAGVTAFVDERAAQWERAMRSPCLPFTRLSC